METLANLESFVRSAETGGFSAAARRLSLTPAAVSRNVAMLERNLGVRLFHRSTRKLTLTEAGERFLHAIRGNLEELQASIASVATDRGEPAGVLKVSMGLTFGVDYILPLLPEFLKRYPKVRPDWQFESRQVDLIAEGFDAAIGGGIELAPGVVSRTLAPAAHHRGRVAVLHEGPDAAGRSVGARRLRWHRHALIATPARPRTDDAQRRGRGDGGCRSRRRSRSTIPRRCAVPRCSGSA